MKVKDLKAILNNASDEADIKVKIIVASGQTEADLVDLDISIEQKGIVFCTDISECADFCEIED